MHYEIPIKNIEHNAIFLCDIKGAIYQCYSQVSKIFGYDCKDLIGSNIGCLIPQWNEELGFDAVSNRDDGLEENKKSETTKVIGLKKDRSYVPVAVSQSIFIIKDEEMLIVSIQDLSIPIQNYESRLEAEKKMRHTQKLESLGLLACNIVHDFNNMLYVILGNANQSLANLSKNSKEYPLLINVKNAALRLTELTKQVLLYSAGEEVDKEFVDFSQIVEEISPLLETSLSNSTEINYCLMKEMPLVKFVPSQIRQIFLNFLTNANDSIGDIAGIIDISTGVASIDEVPSDVLELCNSHFTNYAYIKVKDNGKGIAKPNIDKLFKPFFTTKESQGRGLGLHSVLSIIKEHDGFVSVESELGEGSTFTAFVPCIVEVDTQVTLNDELDVLLNPAIIEEAFDEAIIAKSPIVNENPPPVFILPSTKQTIEEDSDETKVLEDDFKGRQSN